VSSYAPIGRSDHFKSIATAGAPLTLSFDGR
jgi:hypothetical protein